MREADRSLPVGETARHWGGVPVPRARLSSWSVLSTGSLYVIMANTACGVRFRSARIEVGRGNSSYVQMNRPAGKPRSATQKFDLDGLRLHSTQRSRLSSWPYIFLAEAGLVVAGTRAEGRSLAYTEVQDNYALLEVFFLTILA